MKALTKKAKKDGIESEKADIASVEKTATKKKVKIVKRIIKKKVIKKVPKRVSVASNCNDVEKVASPNPNNNSLMEIESSVPVEIEKSHVVNELREVKKMKNSEVSDRQKDIRLVEISDSVTASPLGDQNQIELHERKPDIKNMVVEEPARENNVKEQDEKILKMDHGVSEDTEVDESVKEQAERNECDDVNLEDGVRGEEDMEEKVETDGLNLQEGSSGEVVASGFHLKHKTKLFIHGLDMDTKEEDIRKVFEEIGEVLEVKIITNLKTEKNRGYALIRYSSQDLARLALTKYSSVEICGRLCTTTAVDGSDTILLHNIDKKWNNEHVLELLKKIGIKNIDEVSVISDPENPNLNLGFAYLDLKTKRDAQIVYRKLQSKNVFGEHSNIKVTWVDPLADPVQEETHNIKSVYAEHIPSSWDEKEVKDHFKSFGEIESIALAKNLWSTYRNDFAFINYKTCEAALSCVKSLTCKKSNDNGVKVSLAKSIPKGKPYISRPTVTEVKQKANVTPHNKAWSLNRHEPSRKDEESSTTAELVRLLREQASWKHAGPSLTLTPGMSTGHHHQPLSAGSQPFRQLESRSFYHDPRPYHQTHLQIPNDAHPRQTAIGVAMSSFPRFDPHYTSANPVRPSSRYFQTRDEASYFGSGSMYRQMR